MINGKIDCDDEKNEDKMKQRTKYLFVILFKLYYDKLSENPEYLKEEQINKYVETFKKCMYDKIIGSTGKLVGGSSSGLYGGSSGNLFMKYVYQTQGETYPGHNTLA